MESASTVVALTRGDRLVVLGQRGEVLVAVAGDTDRKQLASALAAHGYPWRPDGDPRHDEYRPWVDGGPDLPVAANALLRACARALEKNEKRDLDELREELARLDVVVRDEKKRQYWRRVRRDDSAD